MKYIDMITTASPMIVAVLFSITSIGFIIKKDYAWSVVWASYAIANISLAILGRRQFTVDASQFDNHRFTQCKKEQKKTQEFAFGTIVAFHTLKLNFSLLQEQNNEKTYRNRSRTCRISSSSK